MKESRPEVTQLPDSFGLSRKERTCAYDAYSINLDNYDVSRTSSRPVHRMSITFSFLLFCTCISVHSTHVGRAYFLSTEYI